MSIEINAQRCIGCGLCAVVCPGSLIRLHNNKASIKRPERCWGCAACLKECPVQAIALFLGADMGGLGSRMTVKRRGSFLHWRVTMPDGTEKIITVNNRDSNQY
jgi:adenylylsulfate reductase subunit B